MSFQKIFSFSFLLLLISFSILFNPSKSQETSTTSEGEQGCNNSQTMNEGVCSENQFVENCENDTSCENNTLSKFCVEYDGEKKCRAECKMNIDCTNVTNFKICTQAGICHNSEINSIRNCTNMTMCEGNIFRNKCNERYCSHYSRVFGCEKDEDCEHNSFSTKCVDKKCLPQNSGNRINLFFFGLYLVISLLM